MFSSRRITRITLVVGAMLGVTGTILTGLIADGARIRGKV